jgi:hypothetical protein
MYTIWTMHFKDFRSRFLDDNSTFFSSFLKPLDSLSNGMLNPHSKELAVRTGNSSFNSVDSIEPFVIPLLKFWLPLKAFVSH